MADAARQVEIAKSDPHSVDIEAEHSRAEIQWRSSIDTLSWSDWQHMCWAWEIPPRFIFAPPEDEFIQIRRVENGKVIWTSPMFHWSGDGH